MHRTDQLLDPGALDALLRNIENPPDTTAYSALRDAAAAARAAADEAAAAAAAADADLATTAAARRDLRDAADDADRMARLTERAARERLAELLPQIDAALVGAAQAANAQAAELRDSIGAELERLGFVRTEIRAGNFRVAEAAGRASQLNLRRFETMEAIRANARRLASL